MANELLEMVMDEMPDAFRRGPGTALDKMKAFVKFYQDETRELQQCYALLPDSLNRRMPERIQILLDRADRESKLAVELRQKAQRGGNSDT